MERKTDSRLLWYRQEKKIESMSQVVYGQFLLAHKRFAGINGETQIIISGPEFKRPRHNKVAIPKIEWRDREPFIGRIVFDIVAGWGGWMGFNSENNMLYIYPLE